ncbi:hypothetical protein [Salisediminibacterium beveridgei]|uniref:Uncharacterized protein n=1 Tax=Salisediminibacterium beveridgei TaxID=632773 RepID=A0A1D7QVA8_9BACI|nr:hypothetical protein [Salisediminibacterium beveridgei]AOM82919.1 hypothetical protein BBEV_1558 [Salisediminibacterium beveridgei]
MKIYVVRENRIALINQHETVLQDMMHQASNCMVIKMNEHVNEVGPIRPFRGNRDVLTLMVNGEILHDPAPYHNPDQVLEYPRMTFAPDRAALKKAYDFQTLLNYLSREDYRQVNERDFHLKLLEQQANL